MARRLFVSLSGIAVLSVLPAAAAQAQLMIPDSGTGDRVMLFSSQDGSLIDANWITDIAQPFVFTTPKEAAVVGNQIWVSDQVADAVHRFDLSRNYLGSITQHPTGNFDNLRGFSTDGTNAYLTMFHGTTTLRGVVTIDVATATSTAFWPVSTNSLFDTLPFNGELLVSNNTTDDIERRDPVTGALLGVFAANLESLQVIDRQPDGSIITAAAIATPGVEGIYHFNADGTLRRFIDTEPLKVAFGEHVPRDAWVLGDGGYLLATDSGVFKAVETAPNTYAFSVILPDVDAQFINPIPEPSCLVLAAGASFLLMRRRG